MPHKENCCASSFDAATLNLALLISAKGKVPDCDAFNLLNKSWLGSPDFPAPITTPLLLTTSTHFKAPLSASPAAHPSTRKAFVLLLTAIVLSTAPTQR